MFHSLLSSCGLLSRKAALWMEQFLWVGARGLYLAPSHEQAGTVSGLG